MSDDIPMWAIERACELANDEKFNAKTWGTYKPSDIDPSKDYACGPVLIAAARLIAKHEPEPVDPLLVMAREAAAQMAAARAATVTEAMADAESYRSGDCDDWPAVVSALTALRMAKEQGLPE